MSPTLKKLQPTRRPVEEVDAEVARVGASKIGELRAEWRAMFGTAPPPAFSKELLTRAIAYRFQEQAYGGLKPPMMRLLRSLAKGGAEPPRQVKVGSVIIREHKGIVHEVLVVPGGFCWQGQIYDSLSTIARRITGVNWNGPRFFGMRSQKDKSSEGDSINAASLSTSSNERKPAIGAPRVGRFGRRSSIRMGERP